MSRARDRWPAVAARGQARRTLRDPGALGVAMVFYVIVATVLATLWRAAAHTQGGTVAGYSAVALTWYVTVSEAVTVSLNTRLIEYIADDIASGAVTVELLRPAPVLGMRIAMELGRCLPRLAGCLLVGGAIAALTGGAPPSWPALALALPAIALGVAINVIAQHACAAAAFWMRDARTTWFLYQKLVFVVGGMLIPLQVLPGALRAVAFALPFAAMAYVPARLASGHFDPVLLLVQAGWLVVVTVAAQRVFRRGELRLQAVGG